MAKDTPTPVEADEAGTETETNGSVAADTSTDDGAKKASIQAEDEDEEDPSLMAEFWMFLKEEKKWWLAPSVIVLVALSTLFVFASGSGVAPFIYTLF